MGTPRTGEVWEHNATGRRVRIEDTDDRWALVRNTATGRTSRPELGTFTRKGKNGWTNVTSSETAEED